MSGPNVVDYRTLVGSNPDRMFKATVFESKRLLLGMNCLEPGQSDRLHAHDDQDKFYLVLEGQGEFVVGGETLSAGQGAVVLASAGTPHSVSNSGSERLVILMGLAPWQ